MHLNLVRYASGSLSTLGVLAIDGVFACHTLENPWKDNQRSISSIPGGTYRLGLRTEGGWHGRALKKFGPEFHQGMIEVKDVPGRTFILLHWGNRPRDTDGCPLVGSTVDEDFVGQSVKAYQKIYPDIAGALLDGEDVRLTITKVGA